MIPQNSQYLSSNSVVLRNEEALLRLLSAQKIHIIKKAERIKIALDILAKHIKDNYQDGKTSNHLQSLAEEFYKSTIQIIDAIDTNLWKEGVQKNILILDSFLDKIFINTQISLENLNILKDALVTFSRLVLDIKLQDSEKGIHFEPEFFETTVNDKEEKKELIKHFVSATSAINDIKDIKDINDIQNDTLNDQDKSKRHKGQIVSNEPIKSGKSSKNKKDSLKMQGLQKSRRVRILEILQNADTPLTMKEISKELPEWSIKTLQREINELIEDGTVTKEGNKRWTKYRINF